MGTSTPFSYLTGALKVYIAPYGEPIPEVQALPAGNWVELGSTDGDQKLKHGGKVTWFTDNDHQGKVKGVRTEEDITAGVNVVDLTLENYARIISDIAKVVQTTNASGIVQKKLPLKRGPKLTEYAVLFRGPALSPYGIFPGMYVAPRAVNPSEPTPAYGKTQRAGLEVDFMFLEDDMQPEDDALGWLVVQIQ